MNHNKPPTAFVTAPASTAPGSFYDSQQGSPRVHHVPTKPEPRSRQHAPTPPPTVTVYSDGRCFFSLSSLTATGLKHGAPFDLVAPRVRGGQWYLDTRPKPGAGYTLPANPQGRCVVRLRPLPASLFQRPGIRVGAAGLITGNTNLPVAQRHLQVGPEVPGYPGYYQLLPVVAGIVNQIG